MFNRQTFGKMTSGIGGGIGLANINQQEQAIFGYYNEKECKEDAKIEVKVDSKVTEIRQEMEAQLKIQRVVSLEANTKVEVPHNCEDCKPQLSSFTMSNYLQESPP